MTKIRSPKPEIRKKLETRNPRRVSLQEAGSRERDELELRLEPLNWPASGFGVKS